MKTTESPIRLEPQLPPRRLVASPATPSKKQPQTRYTIQETLGKGGLGVVTRGHDNRLNRAVAIKRLNPKPASAAAGDQNLLHEAHMLASLNHPNIVSIYDVYEEENTICLVMELLEGGTLQDFIDHSPIDINQFSELVQQTQEALLAAHSAGIVHGDIKPQNILRKEGPYGRDIYKLLDFDQARLTGTDKAAGLTHSTCGSIYFMAPERFEGTQPTYTSDTYAMGCVYYFALTGQLPIQGETSVEVMAAHLRSDIIPLQELRPDLPEWVGQWVHWLMARKPSERPQSPRAVKESFRELMRRFSSIPDKIIGNIPEEAPIVEEKWLVARDNQIGGPHTWETVQGFLNTNALQTTDLIKSESMSQWARIGDFIGQRLQNAG